MFGGHGAHVLVLAAWAGVVVSVLVIDHLRGNRWRDTDTEWLKSPTTAPGYEIPVTPARISMATWPPRRGGAAGSLTPSRPVVLTRDIWTMLAAAGSLAAAVVHLVVMPEHFEESVLYGAFFAATATAQLSYAVRLAHRPTAALIRAGLAGNAAVVALWAYTRMIEVPLGPGRGETEAVGGLDVLATAAEVLIVLAGIRILQRTRATHLGAARIHPS